MKQRNVLQTSTSKVLFPRSTSPSHVSSKKMEPELNSNHNGPHIETKIQHIHNT